MNIALADESCGFWHNRTRPRLCWFGKGRVLKEGWFCAAVSWHERIHGIGVEVNGVAAKSSCWTCQKCVAKDLTMAPTSNERGRPSRARRMATCVILGFAQGKVPAVSTTTLAISRSLAV